MSRIRDIYKGETPTEEVELAIAENRDIMAVITEERLNDDENDSMKLLEAYKEASEEERAILDYALVCITGWTMNTIIEKAREHDPLED